ncbi:MAG: FUSC family protein [Cyanobacteriota bacterium]
MEPQLLRNSLRLGVAILITAAVATWCERITFVWYPLLAVVVVLDDNNTQSFSQASARILGTIAGGLVTFVVHTVLSGWIGVLVSLLVMVPLLRRLGWQTATGTATLIAIMFVMIPSHEALNWDYVFNRSLDTAVGCLIAIVVARLFWPIDALDQLLQLEAGWRRVLLSQLEAYRLWSHHRQGSPPAPLAAAAMAARLQAIDALVRSEQRGPHASRLRRQRWPQRLLLWQQVHEHWLRWESLLAAVPWPPEGPLRPLPEVFEQLSPLLQGPEWNVPLRPQPIASQRWRTLADRQRLPLLVLLAMAEEQKPLAASLFSLQHLWRRQGC